MTAPPLLWLVAAALALTLPLLAHRCDGWAADTWLGVGVDEGTLVEMRDKAQHVLASALLFACVERFFGAGVAWPVTVAAGLAIEHLEGARYLRWNHVGPWPFMADQPSYRDLVADLVGILFAWGLL